MKKCWLGLIVLGCLGLAVMGTNHIRDLFSYEGEIRNIVEILPPDKEYCYRVWVEISLGTEKLFKVGKWLGEPMISYVYDLRNGEKAWMYIKGRRPLSGEIMLEQIVIHIQKERTVPRKIPKQKGGKGVLVEIDNLWSRNFNLHVIPDHC